MRQNTYFISDLHLGASYLKNHHDYERRVVKWLHSIKDDAKSLYLMGDILDYWYEYRNVVPRGYVRFLGALAELVDSGVEVTWFIGNHDIWIFDYLPNEVGIKVIDGYQVKDIDGKRFFLSHGDGLGKLKFGFRVIRSVFRNKFCQRMFSAIHPRWTVPFAHRWSSHSRNFSEEKPVFEGEDKEPFISFARKYVKENGHIDYFVFGHRHILLDYLIGEDIHLIVLGDWIHHFSYGKYDGHEFSLHLYE